MQRSICALVAYDGTDYAGFQVQVEQATIQGALEEGLMAVTGQLCRVTGSGRTDRGVHASGQVVAVDLPWRHSLQALEQAWNHYLPDQILVGRLRERPEGFHPRFSASRRTYRYSLYEPVAEAYRLRRHPLLDRFALVIDTPLDLEAMNLACGALIGTWDFSTFGTPPQGENSVREIFECGWRRTELGFAVQFPSVKRLDLVVTGNAFLKRMVRNLVGSLLKVGQGLWDCEDFSAALLARDRQRSAPPVAPQGLVLERVEYKGFPNLFGQGVAGRA